MFTMKTLVCFKKASALLWSFCDITMRSTVCVSKIHQALMGTAGLQCYLVVIIHSTWVLS